ncbi:DUF3298 domain-containing protein [Pseudomonas gingeri]|uniref:DUF3298 domain-containing protein n=1 Tax=Pseudomonas gingeri TaxID=117681 RepID=UPI0015A4B042|nr:DUF3298 domain-containing protein [Pseudomonas gingeri]NWD05581.1 DUF3298 domain-containing protein [Pseudomonas gingeri]NWE35833.1 DUF3298 domain-containing protein [Pseudomonas gingeri]NWE57958.1 DUF3298 domain-containing protein [Pseudomonas gingeri]NWF01888.1 DUF3298 domain-containing protein [Pseudomonas gingeri]
MMIRALLFAFLIPITASAASFDCGKAHSPLEKAVCADPALSALDSSIAASYNAAMQRLSPDGQTLLRSGQRQWLHFVRDVCLPSQSTSEIGFCLNRHYTDRLKALSVAAVAIGPYLFSRNDYFSAATGDKNGQVYTLQAGAPRIDAPLSPAVVSWNSMMTKQAMGAIASSCDSGHGDEYAGFEMTYASANTLSVKTTASEYCHGTAHGHGGTTGLTYVLKPNLHALEASDLFDMGTAWKDLLAQRSYEALEKKTDGIALERSQVEQAALDVRAWTLTQEGLLITIDPYAVLAYALGTTEINITWRDLKPFLAPNAPILPQS